jgi:hypothetical protein
MTANLNEELYGVKYNAPYDDDGMLSLLKIIGLCIVGPYLLGLYAVILLIK